jgi:hypothetical protein
MDAFTTPGAVSWSELITTDPAAAARFYGDLFGWTIQDTDMGGPEPYRTAEIGGQAVGGIMAMPPDSPPMPPSWGVYMTVADCDATVARCTALGGTCLVPPMDVPTVGRMAVLQDPQGAVFNVMAYATPS